MMADKQVVAPEERNESRIYLIRGQRVMLGMHLAEIHKVSLFALDQAVERNRECFPEGSVFRLTPEEIASLPPQLAVAGETPLYAFTGKGVAMLSDILFEEGTNVDNKKSCAPTCGCHK